MNISEIDKCVCRVRSRIQHKYRVQSWLAVGVVEAPVLGDDRSISHIDQKVPLISEDGRYVDVHGVEGSTRPIDRNIHLKNEVGEWIDGVEIGTEYASNGGTTHGESRIEWVGEVVGMLDRQSLSRCSVSA